MSATPPKVRRSHILWVASMVLSALMAASAPAAARPLDSALSGRSAIGWIRDLAAWLKGAGQERKVDGPKAGTCIDPNGKPKPCDIVAPPGVRGAPVASAPRS